MVDRRITTIRSHDSKTQKRQTLREPICKQALEDLHKDYVLAPADKAGNNIIIICKQYYKEVLTKELTSTSTYTRTNRPVEELVRDHVKYNEEESHPLTRSMYQTT